MLAFADDAALARLVIAAAQRRARLPPRSFPIARSRACPRGLEQSPDAWYPADRVLETPVLSKNHKRYVYYHCTGSFFARFLLLEQSPRIAREFE